VSKTITRSLLALSVITLLYGCSKPEDGNTKAVAPATQPAAAEPSKPHPLPSVMPTAQIDLAGIAKAEGGKTVGEVFGESTALAGKPVSVRGKVVKVNAQIMGKNWLHLRDGSGSDADATNDLTVTTAGELPKVGDTVLVSGQVTTNKDFGMGYQYPVIIEDADVKVEATSQ
jgi:hypothetical protein